MAGTAAAATQLAGNLFRGSASFGMRLEKVARRPRSRTFEKAITHFPTKGNPLLRRRVADACIRKSAFSPQSSMIVEQKKSLVKTQRENDLNDDEPNDDPSEQLIGFGMHLIV